MVIDIIIIAIMAACILAGYRKGLIGVAFHLVSFIIAILVALLLHGPISNFIIQNTQIDDKIEDMIVKNIDPSRFEEGQTNLTKEEQNMPKIVVNYIQEAIQDNVNNAKNNIEDVIAERIAITIINIATIIILFILVRIILIVINKIGDMIAKLPIISQFNKTGGIIYGVIEGLFLIYVLLALCLIITPFIQSTELLSYINTSYIGKMMYNNNILLKFIQ